MQNVNTQAQYSELFALYCQVEEQLRNNPQERESLQEQLNALDAACEMLEDSNDDDYYLIY